MADRDDECVIRAVLIRGIQVSVEPPQDRRRRWPARLFPDGLIVDQGEVRVSYVESTSSRASPKTPTVMGPAVGTVVNDCWALQIS